MGGGSASDRRGSMEVHAAGTHADGMPSLAATLLTVTVRVYDLYGLPTAERHEALRVAGNILAQAGVEAQWVECYRPLPQACLAVLAPGEMVLRFHPDPHQNRAVLGTAFVQPGGPNVMATVHGPAIWDRAYKKNVRLGTLAGRVAAHEIGHLLLGVNSHSPRGLMRPGWDVTLVDPDHWLFSNRDAAAIQRNLRATREGEQLASAGTSP